MSIAHKRLASCPWGPATANGVGILTELYVIYTAMPKIMSIGPLATAGEVVTDGKNHRPLLRILAIQFTESHLVVRNSALYIARIVSPVSMVRQNVLNIIMKKKRLSSHKREPIFKNCIFSQRCS